jgi:uncharacterized nucleotidyltransferase DUF6036
MERIAAKAPTLRADPAYLKAFATIMSRLERGLGAQSPAMPVSACVAGGAALHIYTGLRVSKDIDAKLMARVLLDPNDLQVAYRDKDGHARLLYFDTQYNDSFALLHHDAYDDAAPIQLEGVDARRLVVKLLTPLDLAVSKLARFSPQDQLDIRALARERSITATRLRRRAQEALPDYVGNLDRIKSSIEMACRIVAAETGESQNSPRRGGPK